MRLLNRSDIDKLKEQAHRVEESTAPDLVFKEANNAIESARSAVSASQNERRRQARWTFNLAALMVAIGTLSIVGGVALLIFTDRIVAGSIATGAGALADIFGTILFKFYKDANERLDSSIKEDRILTTAEVALEIAQKIETKKTRDETLQKLAIELGTLSKTNGPSANS